MPRWSTVTERLGRGLTIALVVLAAGALLTAWTFSVRDARQRAAAERPVPQELVASPGGSAGSTALAVPPGFPWTGGSGPRPGHSSATSRPAARRELVEPVRPTHLFVPSIGVNTTVGAKPTEPRLDPFIHKVVPSFGVPDDMITTTWWSSGPRPGARGMAVILGHTQIGGYGVFNKLGRLGPGDVVGVSDADTTLRFQVISVHSGIPKKDPTALSTLLEDHPATARLALLTCPGTFNEGFRESSENTVVFARLVAVG